MTATLAGAPLFADQDIAWSLRAGVEPHIAEFRLARSDAERIWREFRGLRPCELRIRQKTFAGLLLTGLRRGDHPDEAIVQVADHRFLWPRSSFSQRFNVPRETGRRRWLNGVVGDMPTAGPELDYAAWSMRGGTVPWTASAVLSQVLGHIHQKTRTLVSWRLPPVPQVGGTVQDLSLESTADACVRQVLELIPQLSFYLDERGDVVFFDRNDTQDLGFLRTSETAAGPALASVSDFSSIRPSKVILLFVRELELRFDSVQAGGTVARLPPGEAPRTLENVGPNPDPQAVIDGQERNAGEFLTFDELFAHWSTLPRPPVTPAPTHEMARKRWAGRRWAQTYVMPYPGMPASTDWARRAACLYAHYRQTYRVPREWRDRILSWRPERAAILDPVTGRRDISRAYVDYAVVWSATPLFKNLSDEDGSGVNVTGYAPLLADAQPIETSLNVVNQDQIVFQVQFDVGAWGGVKEVYPSKIEPFSLPSTTPTRMGRQKFMAVNAAGAMFLAEEHRVATVFSAIPAVGPLHEMEVPAPANVPAYGPPVEILVSPSLAVCRFAWEDGREEDIEAAFGQGGGSGNLDGLMVNEAEVRDLAQSIAGRYYTELGERGLGALVVPHFAALQPVGGIDGVTFGVDAEGAETTTVQFGLPRAARPLIDVVGEGTRNLLFKLVRGGAT